MKVVRIHVLIFHDDLVGFENPDSHTKSGTRP